MKSRLLLNVTIYEGTAILQLPPCEDQPLLIRGGTILILDLCLHVINSIRTLYFQSDRFSGHSLYKDLHPTAQPQHQVKRRLLLDIIIHQRPPVLKLLASQYQLLLVRRDPLLIQDLQLNVINRIRALRLKGGSLPR